WFVPPAPVTSPVLPVAVLLLASSAVPSLPDALPASADVVLGCTENTSCVAVPAVILNAVLVALPAPVAVSVYPVPTLSINRLANVATQALAAKVEVRVSVPCPEFVPIDIDNIPV